LNVDRQFRTDEMQVDANRRGEADLGNWADHRHRDIRARAAILVLMGTGVSAPKAAERLEAASYTEHP